MCYTYQKMTHHTGIHLPKYLNSNDISVLKKYVLSNNCNNLLIHQIGSVSSRAIVYKSHIFIGDKTYNYAMKIPKPGYERPEEYEINKKLLKYPNHFLKMFAKKEGCQIFILGKYQKVTIYFMELALGDLYQILQDSIDIKQLDIFIHDVFSAVKVLAIKGIKHNDLHIKNVFIVSGYEHDIYAVLGDFGESIKAEFLESHVNDLSKFFSSLLDNIRHTAYLSDLTSRIKRFIEGPLRNTVLELENSDEAYTTEKASYIIEDLEKQWDYI